MGSSVFGTCECGNVIHSWIGGGMEDFMEVCSFPCLCVTCNAVVEANLLQKPCPVCPRCQSTALLPYDDPELTGTPGARTIASWNMVAELGRELRLTDGTYYCPECKGHHLRFEDDGIMFD